MDGNKQLGQGGSSSPPLGGKASLRCLQHYPGDDLLRMKYSLDFCKRTKQAAPLNAQQYSENKTSLLVSLKSCCILL